MQLRPTQKYILMCRKKYTCKRDPHVGKIDIREKRITYLWVSSACALLSAHESVLAYVYM